MWRTAFGVSLRTQAPSLPPLSGGFELGALDAPSLDALLREPATADGGLTGRLLGR